MGFFVWHWDHSSGTSAAGNPVAEWIRLVEREGAAIVEVASYDLPVNHRIIGVGVGHNDADFAETGSSMAAFYENGEAFGGRWWDDPRIRSRYYEPGAA